MVSTGLSLIFGVLNIINMAHGGFFAAGAYLAYVLQTKTGLHPFLGAPLVFLVMFGFGCLVEFLLIRRLRRAQLLMVIITTFALDLLIVAGLGLVFSPTPLGLESNLTMSFVRIGPVVIGLLYAAVFVASLVVAGLLGLVLGFTPLGRAIRAVRMDREAAEMMGIKVQTVFMLAFGLGTGLAAVGGVFAATTASLTPTMGNSYLITAFIVVIIGGIGSLPGAALGAFAYGVLQSVITATVGLGYSEAIALTVMILFLLLRPRGLMGRAFYE